MRLQGKVVMITEPGEVWGRTSRSPSLMKAPTLLVFRDPSGAATSTNPRSPRFQQNCPPVMQRAAWPPP